MRSGTASVPSFVLIALIAPIVSTRIPSVRLELRLWMFRALLTASVYTTFGFHSIALARLEMLAQRP